jgi:uncharacterized protein (DUF302 family)
LTISTGAYIVLFVGKVLNKGHLGNVGSGLFLYGRFLMIENYGFGKIVGMSFEDAVSKTREALKAEGWGVLTELDVRKTMKEKLNKDMPQYLILGACNAPLASRALEAEPSIGLLMPCNFVVREDKAGKIRVEVLDANVILGLIEKNPEMAQLKKEVLASTQKIFKAI